MILKKSALMLLSKLIGLPLDITKGYAKIIRINVPWSKIWKEPIEIIIEDVHALCTVRDQYSEEFAEEMLLKIKNSAIQEILNEIKKNKEGEEEVNSKTSGFFSGVLTAISENIRFNVSGIHLRIEDIGCSIKQQNFSVGIMCDSIKYSITNRKFDQDKFVSKDEKLQENKTFSQLAFKGLALYWISRDFEWWNLNPAIMSLDLEAFIEFSKSHISVLKTEHQGKSSIFIIRPLHLTVKFRTDLNPLSSLPTTTVSMTITPLTISLDFTIGKETFYLIYYLILKINWFKWGRESEPVLFNILLINNCK